jgi:transcriptional regulator with XRE-family HTH domain
VSANHFGERLRELRQEAGLTQKQLAEEAGLTVWAITDLEQGGRQHPRWDTVVALADALGVSCDAFRQAPAKGGKKPGRGRPPKPTLRFSKARGRPDKII